MRTNEAKEEGKPSRKPARVRRTRPSCAHEGCKSRETLPSPRGNSIRYCALHVPRYFDCDCGVTFVSTFERSAGICDECRETPVHA